MSFAINWLAVLAGVVLSWLIGAGYYMALSRQWLAAIGKSRGQINSRDPTPFIIGFVCQLVMASVLAAVLPALFGGVSLVNGALAGALMWLGFVIPAMTLNHRYAGETWSRTVIDGGYLLIALVVQGGVIGLFG